MDAPGLILNLVQKAAARTEIGEDSASCGRLADGDDPPPSVGVAKNPFPGDLPAKSRDDCKKGESQGSMFRVPLMAAEDFDSDKENCSRKRVRVEAKQARGDRARSDEEERIFVLQQLDRSQIQSDGFPAFLCIDGGRIADSNGAKRKIPRPANAFMLFANEWRKKLAAENPRESNKDISVRLGILWKNMAKDMKEKYFALAREVDAEHKRKYPEMDCCNYVEAYAGGGHFYQQQHYFCYDNASAYAGYDPPPISGAIEAGARYNGAMPPAYPTDYVYNPKEARLRKAMREQSRELSRRSILQSAIARAGVITGPVATNGFLDHQHRFGCVSAPGLPIGAPVEPDRSSEPWFQASPRPKPIHSPRIAGDWYGDPIERLQVMGTMHQRALDKCKDPIRGQGSVASVAECGAAFPNAAGYAVDFNDVNRERELRRQENISEYGEFADGQKWHPYQNGGGSHQHPRSPHPSQMGGILHPNVQSPSSHGPGPWGQFCHGVLPHVPAMPRNIGVRGPRHTVLLRDRLPSRHCGFPEETARLTYAQNKLDVDVRPPYSSPEHQMPRLLESSVDTVVESASTSRTRREDEGPRWEPSTINNGISIDSLTSTTQQESSVSREKEARRCAERFEPKKKAASKQPLPGFHQAFGSTEIGRFSRSEFFVNMVGESGGTVDVNDTEPGNLHPKTYLSAPVIFPFSSRSCGILGASAAIHRIAENGEILSRIIPEECCWFSSQSRCGGSRISDNVVIKWEYDLWSVENVELGTSDLGNFSFTSFVDWIRVEDRIAANCATFLDCSHRARDKEWFCQSNTVIHPSGMQAVLRQRENIESFSNDGSYIVIGTGNGGLNNIDGIVGEEFVNEGKKQATPQMEDGSPKDSNGPTKSDGNV